MPRSGGCQDLVGRKSRRVEDVPPAQSDVAPDLSRAVDVALAEDYPNPALWFRRIADEATPTARLKSGAVCRRVLAVPSARRDFRPTSAGPDQCLAPPGLGPTRCWFSPSAGF